MPVWDIVNMSDNVTIITDRYDLATVATMLLGGGNYGANEAGGQKREVPITAFAKDEWLDQWVRSQFPELAGAEPDKAYERLVESVNKLALAEVLRTTQVCSVEDREAYEKALTAIDNPTKKQEYAQWWKEQRRSSMNDIVKRAWHYADRLETLYRQEEHHSDGTENLE